MKGKFLKRPFDLLLSLVGLIISLPLWIIIGVLILIDDGWPIFFTQERAGRKGRIFKALKFRSMVKDAEMGIGPTQAEENDKRVTKVGRVLRATAMDELPQLLNILKGEMSFVGPRALRPEEIEVKNQKTEKGKLEIESSKAGSVNFNKAIPLKNIPGYYKRQSVRPGLTGIAQIFLPQDAPRHQKFRHDLYYIKKQSFWLDLKLIILSFLITFRGKWEIRQSKLWNLKIDRRN